ncbi:hypothetical protein Dsin_003530 [Dipteronia sinensis]|uniref:Uncharacterized protein n=1 Tax=Dipteronia sinensis TaxID=43782 RepID=A0AAE0B9P2_9ROSI|nr:hypothetical protein Dsin_003530 [Dipteronia sinensis]
MQLVLPESLTQNTSTCKTKTIAGNLAQIVGVQLVDCKDSNSYLWKSFMWGMELLEAGLWWRIGDGSSVSIYRDRWLPRPLTFKIVSPPTLAVASKVQVLKNPNGCWNEGLIRESFWPEEADMILSTPCSIFKAPDSLMWHYDKFGNYSVRSGYHLGCAIASNPGGFWS